MINIEDMSAEEFVDHLYNSILQFNKTSLDTDPEAWREVQEVPKPIADADVKESDVRIPEASREILNVWQSSGLKFNILGKGASISLCFNDKDGSKYTIPEQPIPEGMSVKMVKAMWRQGLMLEFNSDVSGWIIAEDEFNWFKGTYKGAELLKRLRISAQPIPEKLLEVPQEVSGTEYARAIPHIKERILWLQQREAGTNEVWRMVAPNGNRFDIPAHDEPDWYPDWKYEVKPKTVTYYFAFLEGTKVKKLCTYYGASREGILKYAMDNELTPIGNIESREVEV